MEDLNSDSDSDENETASQAPGEEAGEVHDETSGSFSRHALRRSTWNYSSGFRLWAHQWAAMSEH